MGERISDVEAFLAACTQVADPRWWSKPVEAVLADLAGVAGDQVRAVQPVRRAGKPALDFDVFDHDRLVYAFTVAELREALARLRVKPAAPRVGNQPAVQEIVLSEVYRDPTMQCRVKMDLVVVEEYAAALQGGAVFPPIRVVRVYDQQATPVPSAFGTVRAAKHYVVDGWHRLAASEAAGRASIMAIVEDGDRRDAILAAAQANGKHGLRVTRDDKRRAARMVLMDAEWCRLSSRKLEQLLDKTVSHAFINEVRAYYQVKPGEVLTEEWADRVDGVPTGQWKPLFAAAKSDWERAEVEKARTAVGPVELAAVSAVSEPGKHGLQVRRRELAQEDWPFADEDHTEEDRRQRCQVLDTVEDVADALRSRDCPDPDTLYKVLADAATIPTTTYFESLSKRLAGRPAFEQAIAARQRALREKAAKQPRQDWEIASDIMEETDSGKQAAGVERASNDVLTHLTAQRLLPEVRDGAYKARVAPDGADACVVPGCGGWIIPVRPGNWRACCARCNENPTEWVTRMRRALADVGFLLQHGYGARVAGVVEGENDLVFDIRDLRLLWKLHGWATAPVWPGGEVERAVGEWVEEGKVHPRELPAGKAAVAAPVALGSTPEEAGGGVATDDGATEPARDRREGAEC